MQFDVLVEKLHTKLDEDIQRYQEATETPGSLAVGRSRLPWANKDFKLHKVGTYNYIIAPGKEQVVLSTLKNKATSLLPITDPSTGEELAGITNPDGKVGSPRALATMLHNTFHKAIAGRSREGENYVTLEEILSGEVGDYRSRIGLGKVTQTGLDTDLQTAHNTIMNFLKQIGLGNYVRYGEVKQRMADRMKAGAKEFGKSLGQGTLKAVGQAFGALGGQSTAKL